MIRGGELSAVTSGELRHQIPYALLFRRLCSDHVVQMDVTTSSETKLAAPSAVTAAGRRLTAAVAVSKYEQCGPRCLDEADAVPETRQSAATADAARAVAAAVQADQAEEGINLLQV